MIRAGDRVTHPDWVGHMEAGVVVKIANRWHADVRFDGWDRPVRAAIASLDPEPVPEIDWETVVII